MCTPVQYINVISEGLSIYNLHEIMVDYTRKWTQIDYELTTKQSQVRAWKQSERRKRQSTEEEAREVPMKMELAWHGLYVVSRGFSH